MDQVRRPWVIAATLIYACLLGLLVLWPNGWAINRGFVGIYVFFLRLGVSPSVKPEDYATLLNVIGLIPLIWICVLFTRGGARWWALGVFLSSCCVESFQRFVLHSRDGTIADVVTNTLGGSLGALAGWWTLRRRQPGSVAASEES